MNAEQRDQVKQLAIAAASLYGGKDKYSFGRGYEAGYHEGFFAGGVAVPHEWKARAERAEAAIARVKEAYRRMCGRDIYHQTPKEVCRLYEQAEQSFEDALREPVSP